MGALYRNNPYRHMVNPEAFSLEELAGVARQMGLINLAGLLEMGGDIAIQVAAAINEAVNEDEAPAPAKAEPAPTGEMSDYEGWTTLAGLVDEALSDQPAELRTALKEAFRAEANKAR